MQGTPGQRPKVLLDLFDPALGQPAECNCSREQVPPNQGQPQSRLTKTLRNSPATQAFKPADDVLNCLPSVCCSINLRKCEVARQMHSPRRVHIYLLGNLLPSQMDIRTVIDLTASQGDPPVKRRKLHKPPREPPQGEEFVCVPKPQLPTRNDIRDADVDLCSTQGKQHLHGCWIANPSGLTALLQESSWHWQTQVKSSCRGHSTAASAAMTICCHQRKDSQ